jgi:hypothetical protein
VVSRVSVFLEKAGRIVLTSQEANILLLVLSQTTSMLLQQVCSYPFGAGPPGTTEGTLALPIMFVSGMPFQVLGPSIRFAAIGTVVHSPEDFGTVPRAPCLL